MATLTIVRRPATKKIRVDIDLDQWERLADALGFYQPSFLATLSRSLRESRRGRVEKIQSLEDIEPSHD